MEHNINQQYAAQQYKETAIKTANPGELIVLLYKEIDKHLNEAITLLTQNDHKVYDKVNHHISRAQQIIIELATSLSKKEDETLYNNLLGLYLFFNEELVQANLAKDHTKIEPVQKMLHDLLESWKTAAKTTPTHPSDKKRGINFEG